VRSRFFAAVFGMLLCSAGAEAQLIGVTDNFLGQQTVYTISTSTGAATKLLDVNLSNGISLAGAEYLNGKLWVTDVLNQPGGLSFGYIDLGTGNYTGVGSQGGSINIFGLAVDPLNSVFYGVDFDNANRLVMMDTSGNATLIGAGVGDTMSGLAFDFDTGVLYSISSSGELYSIDTVTGISTLIGNTGLGGNTEGVGLAYNPDDKKIYLNSLGELYTLDTTDATPSFVGNNGVFPDIGGLGYIWDRPTPPGGGGAVPEPGTVAMLMGFGMAGAAVLRRRR
jgi:hypothetical protein